MGSGETADAQDKEGGEDLHQQQSQLGQFSGQGQLPLAQQGHLHSPSWHGGHAHFPLAQHGQELVSFISSYPPSGPVGRDRDGKHRSFEGAIAREPELGHAECADRHPERLGSSQRPPEPSDELLP